MTDRPDRPALLDSMRSAEYLGVSVTTLYDYVRRGLLAHVKLPKRSKDRKRTDPDIPRRKYQFRREELDRFIEAHVIDREITIATLTSPPPRHQAVAQTGRPGYERDWWKR